MSRHVGIRGVAHLLALQQHPATSKLSTLHEHTLALTPLWSYCHTYLSALLSSDCFFCAFHLP